jgi:hypothetical protein
MIMEKKRNVVTAILAPREDTSKRSCNFTHEQELYEACCVHISVHNPSFLSVCKYRVAVQRGIEAIM